ncbi:MAG: ABC transporter ATP-binding protein [Sphaerobacteraceae bacterium]|nr:MAG: ABC transporter ATP-binding protein [Sphaerobacteraceae bacterium]
MTDTVQKKPQTEHDPQDVLLRVRDLKTHFFSEGTVVRAVDGISYDVRRGEVLGVVGESGSGKSVSGLSLMRLIDSPPGKIIDGSIEFDGQDVLQLTDWEMRRVRGNKISMIFQEPLTSLNPVYTIGNQMAEPLTLHQGMSTNQAWERAEEMLRLVGVPSPGERLKDYPHQLSGGMRQRVMIGMALSCNPQLLIADEPTTALDVSIQAQILELMRELQRDLGTSMIFITHDLGVVSEMCDRVNVMYGGRIVEQADVGRLFDRPSHPYTWGLLDCLPRFEDALGSRLTPIVGQPPNLARLPVGCKFAPRCPYAWEKCVAEEPPLFDLGDGQLSRCWLHDTDQAGNGARVIHERKITETVERDAEPLLQVRGLKTYFPIRKGLLQRKIGDVQAVDGIDFDVLRGETVGLVGESGCGKSTAGRSIIRLIDSTAGSIIYDGTDITELSERQLRPFRRKMQIVFQDPFSSLNPRRTVGAIVGQPLLIHGLANRSTVGGKVNDILERVGLNKAHANRYPHEFSGGQRQRIGIARAIAAEPDFIVADEPVSALDVSIQAQIINLMEDLQAELGLSYIFIAHDLSVVRAVSDRIAVMYLGRIVELAENSAFYDSPLHPYTQSLISAVPIIDPTLRKQRIVLQGDVPSPINPPSGCRFHTRCPYRFEPCDKVDPRMLTTPEGHQVACHLYDAEYSSDSSYPKLQPLKLVEA